MMRTHETYPTTTAGSCLAQPPATAEYGDVANAAARLRDGVVRLNLIADGIETTSARLGIPSLGSRLTGDDPVPVGSLGSLTAAIEAVERAADRLGAAGAALSNL